jgi:hypothetical protein
MLVCRRFALLGVLALVLASSALAASTLDYSGAARRGKLMGPVEFKLTGSRMQLSWEAFGCAYGGGVSMAVKNRRFKVDKKLKGGVEMAVDGKIVNSRKLTGTVRNWYPRGHCSSGAYTFTATR